MNGPDHRVDRVLGFFSCPNRDSPTPSPASFSSSRRNWDSPTLSLKSECAPPPGTKGGGGVEHSPAGEGLGRGAGGPNSDDWRKSLALCLLCETDSLVRKSKHAIETNMYFSSLICTDSILNFEIFVS
jgi:hypothetical protein